MLQGSLGILAACAKVIAELCHRNGTVRIYEGERLRHERAPRRRTEGYCVSGADDFLVVGQGGKGVVIDPEVGGRRRGIWRGV